MAATKGVNHWNLLNSAKGRKLVHTIRNLQPIRGSSALRSMEIQALSGPGTHAKHECQILQGRRASQREQRASIDHVPHESFRKGLVDLRSQSMLTRSLERLKHQNLSLERIREVAYNSRVCTHNEGPCMNPELACSCLNHD